MRTPWEALKRSLIHSTGSLAAKSMYKAMKQHREPLRRFSEAGDLVAYLNATTGDLDEKDRIYRVLVQAVQAGGPEAEVARTLAWLGLWPGLEGIFRRRFKDYVQEPEALVSEIGLQFTEQLHKANLDRINRLAATLVRNVERDVKEELKRARAEEGRRADLQGEMEVLFEDQDGGSTGDHRRARGSEHLRTRDVSYLGLPPELDVERDLGFLHRELVGVIGEDADLVIGAVLYGTQREVGKLLGLSHEAARKRHQRGIAAFREYCAELEKSASQSADPDRVSFTKRQGPARARRCA